MAPVFSLGPQPAFPDPRRADGEGLLAVGGDLSAPRLLNAYRLGIFPWYSEGSPILWWSPPERAILLPGDEHLSRSTRRALARRPFEVRVDTCFAEVIGHCARVERAGQDGTWITREIQEGYLALHRQGYAHSFEAWRDGELRGGLYGVSLGAAFFGESMFSLESYASRAAFAALCRRAWGWGFHLIDGQVPNPNLETLGARVVGRDAFLARLAAALQVPTRRGPWTAEE
ncbi:leucyl/phenylalanyl-tRNA--protein transferase [Mesoterricola silvestris]|uniref:Leucyl/phenylalanyl-tRNA--protein transferase n=1 Tax=Mesoterricola silvestris TaxID=2927979 RepID=A0AA48GGB7_9BACT|nr:leucyl/phenylalanyl-tRNA--protein transferase [Mesoterricola silvestris]BDU72266.1 leucyl/phenylalanyl-tRNA--protein transferase [Mesoterricola silvestris]